LSNEAPIAGQVVMHFHVHVIPKYGKEEGFKIGIGHKYLDNIEKVYSQLGKSKFKKKP
jgi:histidine triad (HIT) family protein